VDFEPEEGRFTWDLFDETLARARAHGKRAAFRAMNGTGTPEWVYAAGAAPYNPRDRGVSRLPLPWDDVFFEKWRAFVQAFGRRYDGHPDVAYVAMSMPAGRWAELLFPVSLPEVPGYSMERFVASHERVVEAYAAVFPRTPLTLAITGHEYDGSLQRVVTDLTDFIVTRFGPDNPRVVIQANGWSERTVMGRNTTVDRTFDACFAKPIRRGLQQIAADSWTLLPRPDTRMGDQRLANVVLLRYGAQYAEVYEGDVAGDRVQPALEQLGALLARRAWLDPGGRLHADGIDRVRYTADLSDPATSRTAVEVADGDGDGAVGAAQPLFARSAYVRYAAFEGDRVALRGGFPYFGPTLWDAARRAVTIPGASHLRATVDGSYPVPIRPDWTLSRSAAAVEGDTSSLDDLPRPAGGAPLRVVPIVMREDGKEALGDVYEIPIGDGACREGAPAPPTGPVIVPPMAAVEDLSQNE
jgi:hypothetical protein